MPTELYVDFYMLPKASEHWMIINCVCDVQEALWVYIENHYQTLKGGYPPCSSSSGHFFAGGYIPPSSSAGGISHPTYLDQESKKCLKKPLVFNSTQAWGAVVVVEIRLRGDIPSQ